MQLTDLHASDVIALSYIERVVRHVLTLEPDIICITGDFVSCAGGAIPGGYAEVLALLPSSVPTFATLGNHDGGIWAARRGGASTSNEVRAILASAGIPCLHNALTEVEVRGRKVQLVGLGDLWNGECRPDIAFRSSTVGEDRPMRLALSHNPDSKELLSAFDWDLMLSGHTHGGQIGIPMLARRFAPVTDKRFIDGLYSWNNRRLHVSRGVGCLFGIRFCCRPEISVLELA